MQITPELIEKASKHYAASYRPWSDIREELGGARLQQAVQAVASGASPSTVFTSKQGGDSFDHMHALNVAVSVLTTIKLALQIYSILDGKGKNKPKSEDVAKPLKEVLKDDVAIRVATAVTKACE